MGRCAAAWTQIRARHRTRPRQIQGDTAETVVGAGAPEGDGGAESPPITGISCMLYVDNWTWARWLGAR